MERTGNRWQPCRMQHVLRPSAACSRIVFDSMALHFACCAAEDDASPSRDVRAALDQRLTRYGYGCGRRTLRRPVRWRWQAQKAAVHVAQESAGVAGVRRTLRWRSGRVRRGGGGRSCMHLHTPACVDNHA
eukprot:353822-Chlamydomonas_euryale.AAC.10